MSADVLSTPPACPFLFPRVESRDERESRVGETHHQDDDDDEDDDALSIRFVGESTRRGAFIAEPSPTPY